MSTYVPIQAITLSAAAATVTFTGIPQNYTDLVLVINASRSSGTGANEGFLRFNSDSSALYSNTSITGNGTSASSARRSGDTSLRDSIVISEVNSTTIIQLQNYSNTTTNKTTLARANSANWGTQTAVGLYRSTSAITSIEIGLFFSVLYASGSTFTLYGIGSGSPKAFGGDEVRTDGTFWYHIFRSSGRFEPVESLSNVDYLVVAGGGGGGRGDTVNNNSGGGGGAGGLRCTVTATGGGGSLESKLSLTANTVYTVTVGAGGANAGSTAVRGTNGSNSVFGSITSTGGGGGGSNNISPWDGSAGGSGGGASQGAFPPYTLGNAGAGTASQGYAGGNSANSSAGGGGGGAGQLGQNGNGGTNTGGAGGAGVATSITGSSVTYAGGGGGNGVTGGAAGSGGGGAGTYNTTAGSGTANTGGGGGASSTTSGSGGSGIVIIRYGV